MAEPGHTRTLNTWLFRIVLGATALYVYALGHDRHKVRTGRESHTCSQTLGERVWLCETRVGILYGTFWKSRFVIASLLCPLVSISPVLHDLDPRSYTIGVYR